MMRRWGYHLSAAAAVLALAACSPSEETNMTDTEESGVTDTADLPGAQLNVAIQAETESLEWLEDVEGERALGLRNRDERAVARSPHL
jgi:prolyl oligopeptidase